VTTVGKIIIQAQKIRKNPKKFPKMEKNDGMLSKQEY
jgi:hypothetical protein